VLIYNCSSDRPGPSFLASIHLRVATQLKLHGRSEVPALFFDHVMFCPEMTYTDDRFKGGIWFPPDPADLTVHRELASAWSSIVPSFPESKIHVLPSIEHAVKAIERIGSSERVKVLVTGCPTLVGGMIEVAGLVSVAM